MADESSEDRTEAATPKRREEAREKGTVAKSTEVNSVLVLLSGTITLYIFSHWMYGEFSGLLINSFRGLNTPVNGVGDVLVLLRDAVMRTLLISMPVVGIVLAMGLAANYIQVGILFTGKPLIPDLKKIDPISGAKRLFALRGLVELAKNLAKLTVIGLVAYLSVRGEFEKMVMLGNMGVGVIWKTMLLTGFWIIMKVCMVLVIIAILDYMFQKYEFEKNLRMSKQEIKEERKQMEGDPQVKSRIRGLQREMARRRMMQEVPRATVVVTNPTHLAIALRYEPDESEAPMVLAKGKDLLAQRIKDIARENDVPLVEDKPLARAMYDKIEVGSEIPLEFFTAIAEILAYVYRLKNKVAA